MDVQEDTRALSCHGIVAEPEALRALRHRLLAWALESGIPDDRAHDIVLAGYEALANVADHAYPGEPGLVDLDAVCRPDSVEVVIKDHGEWRPPDETEAEDDPVSVRGRGLLLVQATADRADVRTSADGTVVTLGWQLD
ncbi:ATP-binding protein [Amycolatopsis sp. NPDC004079]|uniref:ATP-binding protein n=1 Tax=Amycolatopsis halotolerans TaxID=330083 RepID=A0ABV7QCV1_9PSEU